MKNITRVLMLSLFIALFFNMAALEATRLMPDREPPVSLASTSPSLATR